MGRPEANYSDAALGQLVDRYRGDFQQRYGRDLTSGEVNWFKSSIRQAGADSTYGTLVSTLDTLGKEAQKIASVYGIKNFTDADAAKLRDQLFTAGDDVGQFKDLLNASLSRLATEQLINPPVTGEQQTQFQQTANEVVRSVLGRDADQYELEFYSGLLAQGEKPYELQQFVKNTPEYQDAQSTKENERVKAESAQARESLNQELLRSEEEAFKRAQPQIIAQFMRAGRLNSTGLDAAIARERAKMASERQSFLGNAAYEDAIRAQGYKREDFVGAQGKAFEQFLRSSAPTYERQADLTKMSYARPFQLADDIRTRGREVEDYYRQQNDFFRALEDNRRAQREAALYGLGGNLASGALTYAALRK